MPSPEPAFTGSCRCRNVTYTSSTLPKRLTSCYCITCRRLSGSQFITFLSLPRSSITWTLGEASLTTTSYSDLAVRSHCSKCGTPLTMSYHFEADDVGVTLGSVEDESVRGVFPKVEKHIFLGEMGKLGGFEVANDGAARWIDHTETFGKLVKSWEKGVASGQKIESTLRW